MASPETSHEGAETPTNDNGPTASQTEPKPGETNDEAPVRTAEVSMQASAQGHGTEGQDTAEGDEWPFPDKSGFMGWVVYQAAYGLSYGVVFPIALLARTIPKDNAVVHGLVDGAMAARDTVLGRRQNANAETPEHAHNGAMQAAQPA